MILIRRQSLNPSIPSLEERTNRRERILRRESTISFVDYRTAPCKTVSAIKVLNIRGNFYEVFSSTLTRYRDSLLGSDELEQYYDESSREYKIDRDPIIFYSILHFYQTKGRLYCPSGVPEDVFLNELKFFKLSQHYYGFDEEGEEDLSNVPKLNILWTFLETPSSSVGAKVWSYISIAFVLVAVAVFMIETLPEIEEELLDTESLFHKSFFILETTCIAFFTMELSLRAFSSPDRTIFIKNILNWIDFISILPYFIGLIFPGDFTHIFVVLRVLRVCRVLRLARHSSGIKIIFMALSTSASELIFLVFFWFLAIIFFGSLIHYSEGSTNKGFDSIPGSAWWVVVTMSSVGYGDTVPVTTIGKCVGSLCIMCCMLVLALPMTIIISKVTRTYHVYIQRSNRATMRAQYFEQKKKDEAMNRYA